MHNIYTCETYIDPTFGKMGCSGSKTAQLPGSNPGQLKPALRNSGVESPNDSFDRSPASRSRRVSFGGQVDAAPAGDDAVDDEPEDLSRDQRGKSMRAVRPVRT